MNPESLPRSGGVRASSHLPERREAEAPYRALSQRGAQAVGRQLQRTEETEDEASPHQDGVAAAKASGVFEAVRQQFNRDDSPHFMDEDGNLRPRQDSRMQGAADAPPRSARSTGRDDDADPSLRSVPRASANTSPWHQPPLAHQDLHPQDSGDDAAFGSHSAPKDRSEAHEPVYRYSGSLEDAQNRHSNLYQNAAATADIQPNPAGQIKTHSSAPDGRGSYNQSSATAPSTYHPYRSIFQDVIDGHKKYEAEADPTVEMLEQKEKALETQAEGARQALHNQLEIIKKRRELRIVVEGAKIAQDKGKEGLPKGVEVPFDYGMEKLGLSPEEVLKKIDADIAKRQNDLLKYSEEVEKANMALQQAKAETEAARRKAREKNQKQPSVQPQEKPRVQLPSEPVEFEGPGVAL